MPVVLPIYIAWATAFVCGSPPVDFCSIAVATDVCAFALATVSPCAATASNPVCMSFWIAGSLKAKSTFSGSVRLSFEICVWAAGVEFMACLATLACASAP